MLPLRAAAAAAREERQHAPLVISIIPLPFKFQPGALLPRTGVTRALRQLKTLSPLDICSRQSHSAMIALVSRARLQLSVPAIISRQFSVPVIISRQFSSRGGSIDYDSFLSRSARARVPSPIRCDSCPPIACSPSLTPLMAIPGMISLGGGLPNPSTFPFQVRTETLYIPLSAWRVWGFLHGSTSNIASCPRRAWPSHWQTAARCLWMARR
jgi:hypothetical protein